MNQLPSYQQQYDKILDAYMKDEIKPMYADFCICGTLCGNSIGWFLSSGVQHNDYAGYKGNDFVRIENALLYTMDCEGAYDYGMQSPTYENALFKGMCAALEQLKQIHIEKGEIIDSDPVFVKRELVTGI
jgi:hypothetical protein